MLVNAQLLAEGWNSPRATVCMHLAPTASKRIYQQRVGRVTRRQPGKEAGIVVDFVHPATKHDDPVVTLHSLLDRDVYRGGAIVVGPVRRGRGRRLRVERRVVPVTADENRRIEVFERELWRIAVEYLDYGEQVQWAALAGARVAPAGWRRARAMLHFDEGGELKRAFLLTAVDRNKNPQLRIRALQEIAAARDAEAFDRAIEMVAGWPRDEKREGVKVVLQALAEKKIGRRDQANNWIWACAEMTREVHEEYAVQRWPETKRLLGLLVNSSRRRPRAQRAAAGARGAAAGPPAGRGAAGGGAAAHRRGRRGHQRRPHAHVAQAGGAGARAAAQLPEGQGPARAAAAQEGQGRGRVAGAGRGRGGGRRSRKAPSRRSSSRGSLRGAGARRSATPTRIARSWWPRPRTARVRSRPRSRSRSRKRAPKAAAEAASAAEAPESAEAEGAGEEKPKPKRAARKRAPKAAAEAPAAGADEAPPKPKRAARKRAPKPPRAGASCRSRRPAAARRSRRAAPRTACRPRSSARRRASDEADQAELAATQARAEGRREAACRRCAPRTPLPLPSAARRRGEAEAQSAPLASAAPKPAATADDAPKPKRAARKRAPAKPKGGADNGVPTALERASERVREAVQADSGDAAA